MCVQRKTFHHSIDHAALGGGVGLEPFFQTFEESEQLRNHDKRCRRIVVTRRSSASLRRVASRCSASASAAATRTGAVPPGTSRAVATARALSPTISASNSGDAARTHLQHL